MDQRILNPLETLVEPTAEVLDLLRQAKDAAEAERYPELAALLRRVRDIPIEKAPSMNAWFPLAEKLATCRTFLDHNDSTGPAQALVFLEHVAGRSSENDVRQQAVEAWQRVMTGFIEMAPFLAAEEIARVLVWKPARQIMNHAADAVDHLFAQDEFQARAGTNLLTKLSYRLHQNGYEDKAARCAQNWRQRLDAMPLEDALAQVMTVGPRMDCGSPLETEALDFVTKNLRESARKHPELTQQVLDHLLTFSRPGGACSVEVRKKLQALSIAVEKRGDAINVRHRGSGLERYEF